MIAQQTKYAQMVIDAQLAHLQSLRTKVADMVHARVENPKDIVVVGAAGLTVGDWVEVMHDFSPGNNSGGGVGVITAIVDDRSHVDGDWSFKRHRAPTLMCWIFR